MRMIIERWWGVVGTWEHLLAESVDCKREKYKKKGKRKWSHNSSITHYKNTIYTPIINTNILHLIYLRI